MPVLLTKLHDLNIFTHSYGPIGMVKIGLANFNHEFGESNFNEPEILDSIP